MVEENAGVNSEQPSDETSLPPTPAHRKQAEYLASIRLARLASGLLGLAGGCLIAIELALAENWIASAGTIMLVLAGISLWLTLLHSVQGGHVREQRATKRWLKALRKQELRARKLGDEIRASAIETNRQIGRQVRALTDVVLYQDLDRARIDARGLPLIMISQVQRSGGTLLSQLFDGHPHLLAFPQELKWGETVKHAWPTVEPSHGMHSVMRRLIKGNLRNLNQFNATGYVKQKDPQNAYGITHRWSYWQYIDSFMDEWLRQPPERRRDCLEIFFSAYFSAFGGLRHRDHEKSAVTAFTPRFSLIESMPDNVEFFSDYPDGLLICLCRRPVDWYASASHHAVTLTDSDVALELWRESARCGIALSKRFPRQVVLLTFESLVRNTRETMTRLARRLAVPFDEIMLVPTFNGRPVSSNSSFDSAEGIQLAVLERASHVPEELQERINLECMALYKEFSERAEST